MLCFSEKINKEAYVYGCPHKKVLWKLGIYNLIVPLFHRLVPMYISDRRIKLLFFSQFVRPGDLCFDIGANRGDLTKIFLALGARKVVSVEPQDACAHRLHQIFDKNKEVVIVEKAIADYKGQAELAICEEKNALSTLSDGFKTTSRYAKDHHWNRTQSTPVTTLDALIQQYGAPDFCKIDVEGAEEAFSEDCINRSSESLLSIRESFTRQHGISLTIYSLWAMRASTFRAIARWD
jgi:FkbM family methyltransferase